MMPEQWVCGDCGYEPVGRGRPSISSCPQCRGDFTWAPAAREKIALNYPVTWGLPHHYMTVTPHRPFCEHNVWPGSELGLTCKKDASHPIHRDPTHVAYEHGLLTCLVQWLHPDDEPDPRSADTIRREVGEDALTLLRQVVKGQ